MVNLLNTTAANAALFQCNEESKICEEFLLKVEHTNDDTSATGNSYDLSTLSSKSPGTSTASSGNQKHKEKLILNEKEGRVQPLDLTTHSRNLSSATDYENKGAVSSNGRAAHVTVEKSKRRHFTSTCHPHLQPSHSTSLLSWSVWISLLFPNIYSFASPKTLPSPNSEVKAKVPHTSIDTISSCNKPNKSKENYFVQNLLAFRQSVIMLGTHLNSQSSCLKRQHTNHEKKSTSPKMAKKDKEDGEPMMSQLTANGKSLDPQPVTFPPCRLPCDICGRIYATGGALTKHVKTHETCNSGDKINCNICKKECSSLGALRMHIRTHTLPCECHICGKAFFRTWLLQGHIRTHTGEKPYQCSVCSRAFADRSNLRAHMQIHKIVKRYSCVSCEKTFSRISLLKRHQTHCDATEPQL